MQKIKCFEKKNEKVLEDGYAEDSFDTYYRGKKVK